MSFFDDIQIIHPVKYCFAINLRFISQGKLCGWEFSKKITVLNMNNVSYGMVINQDRKVPLFAEPF